MVGEGEIEREGGAGGLARLYKHLILKKGGVYCNQCVVAVFFSQCAGGRLALPPPKIERHEAFRQSTGVERVYTEKNRHSESVPK